MESCPLHGLKFGFHHRSCHSSWLSWTWTINVGGRSYPLLNYICKLIELDDPNLQRAARQTDRRTVRASTDEGLNEYTVFWTIEEWNAFERGEKTSCSSLFDPWFTRDTHTSLIGARIQGREQQKHGRPTAVTAWATRFQFVMPSSSSTIHPASLALVQSRSATTFEQDEMIDPMDSNSPPAFWN